MLKKDFINAVASNGNISKSAAERAIDTVIGTLMSEISNGEDVTLTGFGKFYSVEKEAMTARNPKNGKAINVPAKRVPKFKYSTTFKKSMIK